MLRILDLLLFISGICLTNVNGQRLECESVSPEEVLTSTSTGKLQGHCIIYEAVGSDGTSVKEDIFLWQGIPYAEPPIGENRWKNPIPIKAWDDVKNATETGSSCVQGGGRGITGSEDCLFLNVYAKKSTFLNREKELKPILFWIHGGGYTTGSGNLQAGVTVAREDIVVIAVNYRLGVYGFLHLEDSDATGNYGFLDQHVALQWAYDNAAKFGGDHTKITVAGTSAGAALTNFHLYYQPSWPLFRNAFMSSSGISGPNSINYLLTKEESSNYAREAFSRVGCSTLECAKEVDAATFYEAASTRDLVFNRMTQDGAIFKKTIDELTADDQFKKCNIITGFTSDELQFSADLDRKQFDQLVEEKVDAIVPFELNEDHLSAILETYFGTDDLDSLDQSSINWPLALTNITSDAFIVCASLDMARIYSEAGQNAYVYEFKYKNSESSLADFYYASHGTDTKYLTGSLLGTVNRNQEDRVFNELYLSYFANFIKNDDPNVPTSIQPAVWTPYGEDQYLLLKNNDIKMKFDSESHHCNLWNNPINV